MTREKIVTLISVLSVLVATHHALLNYPLIKIFVPWFVIPLAAWMVFYSSGETPEPSAKDVWEAITGTTLMEKKLESKLYKAKNTVADNYESELATQLQEFSDINNDIEKLYNERFRATLPNSWKREIDEIRELIIENTRMIRGRLGSRYLSKGDAEQIERWLDQNWAELSKMIEYRNEINESYANR